MRLQEWCRYGSHAAQFPGRVGAVVEGSYCETVFQVLYCTVLYCTVLYCTVLYCETVFQECRAQQCHVQSPGFPGVYPRGVSCRCQPQ